MGDRRGLFAELVADGRPALSLMAIALLISGLFAIFLSFRREFLPHDVGYLGMTADELCRVADCRVVRFMFHDRVSFGGTLIAVAMLYLWLATFPLRDRESWAWWTFAGTGAVGFASFLAYLGYGYLDVWHGAATAALLPAFLIGLLISRRFATVRTSPWMWSSAMTTAPAALRFGRWGLMATGAGILLAGIVILYLGSTDVFVAEDLAFMGIDRQALEQVNPRLIPLIAHDRAGFGGGLATMGALLMMCSAYAPPSRSFHEAVCAAGVAGFSTAIGTHFVEGYVNPVHLAPALAGAALFAVSITAERLGTRATYRATRRSAAR